MVDNIYQSAAKQSYVKAYLPSQEPQKPFMRFMCRNTCRMFGKCSCK